jgi:hypothetical protein
MEAVVQGARRVTRWCQWFGGALVLLAAVLIGIDVVMRKLFSASIGGADELAGYALALGTPGRSLPPWSSAHIASILYLPPAVHSGRGGPSAACCVLRLVAWHGWVWPNLGRASRSQSTLQTPIVIPQFIWLLGL